MVNSRKPVPYFPALYGFTKHPELGCCIVMEHCSLGNLQTYLSRNSSLISWNERRNILHEISIAISLAHEHKMVHCDLHTRNVLKTNHGASVKVADFGLSKILKDGMAMRNATYGVLPYMAPELLSGGIYSKATDIYALGMIMWELTTGCKPFASIEHDIQLIYQIIDGIRPEITDDTPECFANLMKKCWDSDPKKRPSIIEIHNTFEVWFDKRKNRGQFVKEDRKQFEQAEIKRRELMNSKKLGPEFTEKPH